MEQEVLGVAGSERLGAASGAQRVTRQPQAAPRPAHALAPQRSVLCTACPPAQRKTKSLQAQKKLAVSGAARKNKTKRKQMAENY